MKIPKFSPEPGLLEAALKEQLWRDGGRKAEPEEVIIGEGSGRAFRFLKRAMDLAISLLAICLVLSWLLPLLSLLILLDTGAPVLFIQERIGRHNRTFRCIKLRTMRRHMAGRRQLTRFGYWLRCHKLDEVPQFFNVLKGEMSIVGPRPHMLSDHHEFCRIIGEDYKLRHAVLPGITGLAQVNGFEGPVVSTHKLRNRIRLDLFYIRHWSVALEFRIMYRTIRLFAAGIWNELAPRFGGLKPKNEK